MADEAAPRHRRRWLIVLASVVVVCALFALGLAPRLREREGVRAATAAMTVPSVSVVRPQHGTPTTTIVLPANVMANSDSPIFSRANGYVAAYYVDIGAHVDKNQLLAVIAIPEIDQQLAQARSTLAMARANLQVAQATASRFSGLQHTRAVSQQEVDTAVGTFHANEATVEANVATVRQLEQALEYGRIRAPFEGVISVRNIDIGDLINAGSSTTPKTELFHIVQADVLRVYVSVPEAYAQVVVPKLTAEVTFTAFPGRAFVGTLVRTAKAIDPVTRTLNAELEVANANGELLSGGYAEVRLIVPARATLVVPVETLLFRKDGLHVATVVGGKVALAKVTAGHDFGETIEITHGLRGDELVIQNPSDSIGDGQEVRVAAAPAAPASASR